MNHPAPRLSLPLCLTLAAVLALPAAAQQMTPQAGLAAGLPGVLPPDHSDRTETHGCLCDDWFLGLMAAEGEVIALASIDPRRAGRDWARPEADVGSLADTRHLNQTLLPRLLTVRYDFELDPDRARLLLAGGGVGTTMDEMCRIRATIQNVADVEFPDLAYLFPFDWTMPADEVENRVHLAGLAPISGAGLGLPAGLPECTGPSDGDLRRFFADGAPIPLAGPLPPGGTVSFPVPPPPPLPQPNPPILISTPPGGGGGPIVPTGGDPGGPGGPGGPEGPEDPSVPVIPLPAALWLLLGGLGVLAAGAGLRTRRAA